MAVDLLAEILGDVDGGADFVFPHHCDTAMGGGAKIAAGNIDLDVIDTFAAAEPHDPGDLVFAIGDHAEAFVIHVLFAFITEATRHGDLRAGRAHAWSRQATGIDLIANDDIQAELGRGSAIGAGKTMIEQRLGIPHGEEQMLFRRNIAEIAIMDGTTERYMRMTFDQARHQGAAMAINGRSSFGGQLTWRSRNCANATAFHQDIGGGNNRRAHLPRPGSAEKKPAPYYPSAKCSWSSGARV